MPRSHRQRALEALAEVREELRLHSSGLWTRPGTYDRAIVRDSELYLELDPGPADVLLDLGANIGAVTRLFLERGVRHVVAVEPEPRNFELLVLNTVAYAGRVTTLNVAAAGKRGIRTLWLQPGPNRGAHSIAMRKSAAGCLVPCRTLAKLVATYEPTLLKIDVEGAEYELLDSLATLPRCVRGIAIELHFDKPDWRRRLAPRLVAILERQGFVPTEPPELTGRARTLVTWLRR
jgi:FkbM family methyltransferase